MYFLCGFFFRQVKILHSFSFFCWQATLMALSSPICYFYALWRLIECIFILAHCSKIWRNEIRNVVYLVLGSNPLACWSLNYFSIFSAQWHIHQHLVCLWFWSYDFKIVSHCIRTRQGLNAKKSWPNIYVYTFKIFQITISKRS